jgi:hypothetical protein
MAEYVKRRFSAARAGMMAAIFGLGVGVGLRGVGDGTERVDVDPAATKRKPVARNAIGSAQIKNRSIQLGDIKLNQVASYKEFKAFAATVDAPSLLHKNDAYIKGESDALFLHKNDAYIKGESDALFLHKDETAASALKATTAQSADNALKLGGLAPDQLVQGHGQVVTGSLTLTQSPADVFILIGLLRASANVNAQGAPTVTLENLSGAPLMVNGISGQNTTTTIQPGGSSTFAIADGSVRSLQIIGGAQVVSATLSSFGGQAHTVVGQVVVGTP